MERWGFPKMPILEISALKIGLRKRLAAERKPVSSSNDGKDLDLNRDNGNTTLDT